MSNSPEPFSRPFPFGFAILALILIAWFFKPIENTACPGVTTQTERFALTPLKKGPLKQVWELEDILFKSIETRLAKSPARFGKSGL